MDKSRRGLFDLTCQQQREAMLSTNSDLDKRIAHMQLQEPTPLLLSLSA
jgi:hypothetical protein